MKEKDHTIESQKYEIRNDGDIIVVSGEKNWLAEVGSRIVGILNRSVEDSRIFESLLRGEEIRPGGAYAVYILMGKLYIDTRNARGELSAREEIKKAVESVL